jgi:vacuolar-type H+-ATPase subunit H
MQHTDSAIEETIRQIERLIDESKPAGFLHRADIIINREMLEGLIRELRENIPEEVERYRLVISNTEAIEREARANADELLAKVQAQTDEMLSENEIMVRAQKQADEIIQDALNEANEIRAQAQYEADQYTTEAVNYLNKNLYAIQSMIDSCVNETTRTVNKFLDSLGETGATIQDNINELNGAAPEPQPLNLEEEGDGEVQ